MLISNLCLPAHVGILMDGNRKWAASLGIRKEDGHIRGKENLKKICLAAKKLGIEYLTTYAFSIENWKREREEIQSLINIIKELFEETKFFVENDICVRVIGEKIGLEEKVLNSIDTLESLTQNCSKMILTIAFNYGGFHEIISATKRIYNVGNELQINNITENVVNRYMQSNYLPELDLIIRTGNVKRLSRFLIWKSSNAELIFLKKYWPEFNESDLIDCLIEYSNRKRNSKR